MQTRIALLMLDRCRFKEVNDTLGHDVGEEVLREVSRRFAALSGERGAFIGRIGRAPSRSRWREHRHRDRAPDAKDLLRHADVAMYVAKRQGNAYEYCDRGDDDHTVRFWFARPMPADERAN
jgi:GGDEF domain-containing protein